LILTLDYEVFGNGSGCLKPCVLDPVNRLLQQTRQAGAGLDVFVDALEFEQMRRHRQETGKPFETEHLLQIEDQIRTLMQPPHSVHLHLHPQWLNARPTATGWQLDFSKWRIGSLSGTEIAAAIATGKQYLQSLNPAPESFAFHCFRAGGWAIQPSQQVLGKLRESGIQVDSTVAPGAVNRAGGDWFDFRRVPDKPYWTMRDDVLSEADGDMLEVPIATQRLRRADHLRALREARRAGGFPAGCQGSYQGPNNRWQEMAGKLGKLANLGLVMLDFSTLPAWALIEVTNRYMERFSQCSGAIPIVAIGHNKNFSAWSEHNLAQYLDWAAARTGLTFSSYAAWLAAIGRTV
jgi:hypothetical protein